MKIKLDEKHYLESDPLNIWITVTKVSENGKEYKQNVTGYYRSIDQLLENYIDRSLLASKATSFAALKRDIQALKKQVFEWENVLTLNDIKEMEKPVKKARRKKA